MKRTPLEQLEEIVKVLTKHRPTAEVRQAMIVIAAAPRSHFETLKRDLLDALPGRSELAPPVEETNGSGDPVAGVPFGEC